MELNDHAFACGSLAPRGQRMPASKAEAAEEGAKAVASCCDTSRAWLLIWSRTVFSLSTCSYAW